MALGSSVAPAHAHIRRGDGVPGLQPSDPPSPGQRPHLCSLPIPGFLPQPPTQLFQPFQSNPLVTTAREPTINSRSSVTGTLASMENRPRQAEPFRGGQWAHLDLLEVLGVTGGAAAEARTQKAAGLSQVGAERDGIPPPRGDQPRPGSRPKPQIAEAHREMNQTENF